MINSNIAMGAQPVQIENPMNALAKMMQIKQAMQENQMGQMKMDEYSRSAQEGKQLNALYASSLENGVVNKNKLYESMAQAGFGSKIAGMQEQDAKLQESRGKAREYDDKAIDSAFKRSRELLNGVTTPQQYIAWHESNHSDPHLGPYLAGRGVTADQSRAKIMEALRQPNGLQTLIAQSSMGMDKFTERNTQTADNRANNLQSDINSRRQLQSSREGHANTLAINGMGANGANSSDVESMAQAIAGGKLAPINGFALAKPRGQAIMARAMEINPTYDAGDYAAKNNALKGFSTGKEGAALRSFNVATDHLETLGTMADALHNGNVQVFNKAGNFWSKNTGSEAPTNFNAVKEIVGKEVVKAIVAGGGGVEERKEMSNLLDAANSPKQLKGVITHFKELMGAQRDGLLDQYERTTGRKDGKEQFAPKNRMVEVDPSAYSDAEKERRYQEFKAKAGQK